MIQLKEGIKAPLFEGIDQNGNKINLDDFTGKKVDIIFLSERQYTGLHC